MTDALRAELATANHILFRQGVVDAFGHISVRDPQHPGCFLLARSMAPASVAAGDVMRFGPDSEPAEADDRRPYLERFIHGEIYRQRPDVISVVHSHSPAVIPFGIVKGARLRPVFHMSGFLGKGATLFEIRCCGSDATDMLIRDRDLGAALAVSLGEAATVLMRGHGSTTVGHSIRQAVYRAVYAEVNARAQSDAMRMGGEVEYLTEGEAHAAMITNDGQLARAWDMWASQAQAAQNTG